MSKFRVSGLLVVSGTVQANAVFVSNCQCYSLRESNFLI